MSATVVLPNVAAHRASCGLAAFSFRIAHKLPGRVRIIRDSADEASALRLARRFAHHPSVISVRCALGARSLTVQFDPTRDFGQILDELPDEGQLPAPVTVVSRDRLTLLRLGTLLLDLVSGNPLAIAQTVLNQMPTATVSVR